MTEYVPQELVTAFVEGVAGHFGAIEHRYGFIRSLEAGVSGPQGLERVRPEQVGNRFFLLRFELTATVVSVVISYGDREHDMNCHIRRGGFQESYTLREWLDVSDWSNLLEDHGGWVLQTDRVHAVIALYERLLELLLPAVVAAGPAMELQLKKHRQEQHDRALQPAAQREHMRLAAKADEAFRQGDYDAVVKMLSAIQTELSAGERAKLAFARKRLVT